MRLQAFHCPSCAAQLDIAPGATRVTCAYCGGSLVVEGEAVTHSSSRPARKPEEKEPAYPPPDSTLFTREAARFEMSVLEQKIPEGTPDRFTHLELGDERFALLYLRFVDADGAPVPGDLSGVYETIRGSLEDNGDPGLAANLALEGLAKRSFPHRLEVLIALFEPRHMTMTAYNAGCRDAVWWVSNEEGRCTTVNTYHDALERKMLRETRDHFSNSHPVHLAAGDLFVVLSAGFCGRGGKGRWPTGTSSLTGVLNDHLGEDPLRVVTLAKNAFWENRSSHRDGAGAPVGDVKIAAVRAIPPPMATKIPGEGKIEVVKSRKFEAAFVKGPRDHAQLHALKKDRKLLIWFSPVEGALDAATVEKGTKAVLEVLDGETGDNDNPRLAGRDAYEAMNLPRTAVKICLIQMFDEWGRVKYSRFGWKMPVALGPRGVKSDGQQQFDEGGEATVHPGSRLFFPGPLEYEGECNSAEQLGQVWQGGKASRVYEAMWDHWKTKKTDRALEKFILAAASDVPLKDAVGIALVGNVSS